MSQIKYSKVGNFSFMLQLKIISGYILLLLLLSIIIGLVWLVYKKMENLSHEELYISQKREVVNQTFEKLLDFSFSDDFLQLRDNDKFDEYRTA